MRLKCCFNVYTVLCFDYIYILHFCFVTIVYICTIVLQLCMDWMILCRACITGCQLSFSETTLLKMDLRSKYIFLHIHPYFIATQHVLYYALVEDIDNWTRSYILIIIHCKSHILKVIKCSTPGNLGLNVITLVKLLS